MVVALLMHCLKSTDEIGDMSGVSESNDSLVAFGMEIPLAGVDCPIIERMCLWEPLELNQNKHEDSKAELCLTSVQNA